MTRNPILRDRVAAAILDAAATVLAERADASMADVATAAGVGRTTLYRYFPNREQLLEALGSQALNDLVDRIEEAGLQHATVPEGIARVTRAVLGAAGKYQALASPDPKPDLPDDIAARLRRPLIELFDRGTADGTLRTDLSAQTLLAVYIGLLEGILRQGLRQQLGTERAASAVTSVFLSGASDLTKEESSRR